MEVLREDVPKKAAVLLDFGEITFPPPNLDNLYNFFLHAKNVDLSVIPTD